MSATGISETSATLHATINPDGAFTSYDFVYTPQGGSSVSTPNAGPISGQSVSQSVSGLSPGTTYLFHVVAQNANGTATGSDLSFKTAAPRPPPTRRSSRPVARA